MRQHVHEAVALPAPLDAARVHVATAPRLWLPAPARPVDDGVVVTMRAVGVAVDAVVEVGDLLEAGPDLLVRPIAWRARQVDRLFPRMVGELELSGTATRCQLTLIGGYEPPISVVGDAADRLVGRHVATSVVRDLLEDVAHRLVELTGAATTTPSPAGPDPRAQ